MRRSVLVLAFCALAAPAAAECNRDMLKMTGWEITPIDERYNRLTTRFIADAEKPIRMIDASAGFRDALGGSIASFSIKRDTAITPGQEFTQTGEWGLNTFERLLNLKYDEVETFTCVRAVLYDDGTKERFDQVAADAPKGDVMEALRRALQEVPKPGEQPR